MKDILVLVILLFSVACLALSLKSLRDTQDFLMYQQDQINTLNSNLEYFNLRFNTWQWTVNSHLSDLEEEENTYGAIDK